MSCAMRPNATATKCHNEGEDKSIAVIEAVRRAFHLMEEDGVSDQDFCGRA